MGCNFSNAYGRHQAALKRVQYKRAGPPGQQLHRWPVTCDHVFTIERGLPTLQITKKAPSRSAG